MAYDADPNTGFPVYDSYGYSSPWAQYGGTSDAAPQWAALIAIADQGRSLAGESALTGSQLLTDLYQLPSSDFNDTTTGSSTGSPSISASAGYDLVTGRGTPKANLIVPALVGQTNPAVTTHLAVSAPSTDTAGGTFSITVTAENGSNGTTSGYTGTIHFSSSDVAAGLPANYTFTAADAGVHTFTGLVLKTAGSQTITATDTSSSSITGSATVAVSAAAASQLVFGQQPTGQLVGATLSPTVTVKIEDAYNNVLTGDSTDKVTIALGTNPSGATLGGTTTATVSGGVATFGNLSLNLVGTGYTLVATSTATSSGVTSSTFNISANTVVTHLGLSTASSETAGNTFSLTVSGLNSANAAVGSYTGTIHFSSSDVAAGLPANYTFTSSDAGVHTFSGLVLKTAGSRTITAADTSSSSITGTATVSVTPNVATHLAFVQSPTSVVTGTAISPAVTVAVEDAYGNIVTSDSTDQITLVLSTNPTGATLSGTTTATVSGGIATFGNLSLSTIGTGYTLAASSGTLTGVTSAAFNVTAVPSSDADRGLRNQQHVQHRRQQPGKRLSVELRRPRRQRRPGDAVEQRLDLPQRLGRPGNARRKHLGLVPVHQHHDARAYFGFGASSSGTLSLVAAPNTNQLILQSNAGYGYTNLAVATQSFTAGTWYKMQVNWSTSGSITGQLYASNGTTLLSSVTATNTSVSSGGIAFRAIGAGSTYFDTVSESTLSSNSSSTSSTGTSAGSTSAGTGSTSTGGSSTGFGSPTGFGSWPWASSASTSTASSSTSGCPSSGQGTTTGTSVSTGSSVSTAISDPWQSSARGNAARRIDGALDRSGPGPRHLNRQPPTAQLHNCALHDCALHDCVLHDCALHNCALHDCALHDCALHDCAFHNCALHDCDSVRYDSVRCDCADPRLAGNAGKRHADRAASDGSRPAA